MKRFAFAGLTLAMVSVARPPEPPSSVSTGIPIQCHDAVSCNRVRSLTVLPGESLSFEIMNNAVSECLAQPAGGRIVPRGKGRWEWTSPSTPGVYPIRVSGLDGYDAVTLQAFVVVPFDRLRDEYLDDYRIGRYPDQLFRDLDDYAKPTGFIEVTKDNENALVSPHFRLRQFLCKETSGSKKYIILNERLPLALEYALQRVNEAGYRASTFNVMSGYRTPAYNKSLGNVRYSLHQWGAAADIFIDENDDGVMDDLNGDGVSDIRDAEALYNLLDAASALPEAQGLIGGLGKYPPTAAHGPFVHLDVRECKARW